MKDEIGKIDGYLNADKEGARRALIELGRSMDIDSAVPIHRNVSELIVMIRSIRNKINQQEQENKS